MAAPAWIIPLLGYRSPRGSTRIIANVADSGSAESIAIAEAMFTAAGVRSPTTPTVSDSEFERMVRTNLQVELAAAGSSMVVGQGSIRRYNQYLHLERLDQIIKADATGTLSAEIGRDYMISADVIVHRDPVPVPSLSASVLSAIHARWPSSNPPILDQFLAPFLHAAISLKWTIRSDRVQNIRHEAVIMSRARRSRQPHIVVVTLEPLPSRLASIARGTGEVDAVYHVCFEELWDATMNVGGAGQQAVLEELVSQGRLLPWNWVTPTLLAA